MKVKDTIKSLVPYKPNIQTVDIKLDANEGENYLFPKGITIDKNLALYPESNADSLREELALKFQLESNQFIVGNGSTELLEIAVKTYCNPNDLVLSFTPSFSMYEIYATINGARFMGVTGDNTEFQSVDLLIQTIKKENPKIVFLCNPNNPTGSVISKEDIKRVVEITKGLVIIDEAYMEFCQKDLSFIRHIKDYDNVVVAKTFSKAYGLAYSRIGYLISNKEIIDQLLSVKLPYNVNGLTLYTASKALEKEEEMSFYVNALIKRRKDLYQALKELNIEVYPTQANFIYLKSDFDLAGYLLEKGILIRQFENNYYRITIGSKTQNESLLKAIKECII